MRNPLSNWSDTQKLHFHQPLTRTVDRNGFDLGVIRTPIVSLKPAYFSPEEVGDKLKQCGIWQMSCATIYRQKTLQDIGFINRDFHITFACVKKWMHFYSGGAVSVE